ncbi:MAG: oligosaccharide flippase family protein, partial [bacterium]|nr:oligosaccharide flippase family protein [bacterium]
LSLRMILAAAAVLLGLAYAYFYPHPPVVKLGIMVALTTVFTQGVFVSLNALFQHNLRYDLSVLANILAHVVSMALVVWGFFSQAGLIFFVLAWVATYFTLAFLALILSRKVAERPRFAWDPKWIRRIFRASLPIGLMLVFSQINSMADVFLLRALDSAEAVGIYRLGYKVFENILPIPIFFVNALYPIMLADHQQGLFFLYRRLKHSISALLAVSLLAIVVVIPIAGVLISILGGAEFSDSSLVLKVLVLALPFFFMTAPLQWFLITVGKERVLPVIYALAAFFNVSINILFIPRFSYFASISATVFSEILILTLLAAAVWRFKRGFSEANPPRR